MLGSFSIEGPTRMSRITVDRPPSRSVGAGWGPCEELRGVKFGELGGRQVVSEKREAGLAGVKVGGVQGSWPETSQSFLFVFPSLSYLGPPYPLMSGGSDRWEF